MVIAIIGILASIVLVSLLTVRNKAKNAVIRMEVDELAKLMELEYADTGSYSNLQIDSIVPSEVSECEDVGYAGNYAGQAVALCEKVLSLAPELAGSKFLMANEDNDPNKYSIMATLWTMSATPNFYCVGSSGKYEGASFPFETPNEAVGCYWNP